MHCPSDEEGDVAHEGHKRLGNDVVVFVGMRGDDVRDETGRIVAADVDDRKMPVKMFSIDRLMPAPDAALDAAVLT